MSEATQPNGLTNSTNANITCDCKSKCARKKGRGVCPCKSAGKTCSPSCNCSFEKCQNKNTATENRPERKSTSQPEAEELQFFTAKVRLPETETQQEVLEIITAMANRETQENLCRSEVTQIYMTEQRRTERTERTVPLGSPKSKQSSDFDASKNQPNLPDFDFFPSEIKEKKCSPSCNCSFEKCQNKNTATENRPERKSTSQPEAEELQFFTAKVRLPETETQQEVLEIITAMANRETQENLCRSEVTQIYMTEQRRTERTERTVPLGSPKSKQSSDFDASKNQPNLPDFDFFPSEIKEKKWGNISYQSLSNDINNIYDEIVHFRKNIFNIPSGRAGKMFIDELTFWLKQLNYILELNSIALKAFMVLPSLILQKPSSTSKSKEHSAAIERRLALWKQGDLNS